MGIKHFQKFNVRRQDGNQVSFILPVQLCRTETAEGGKDLMTDQRQQLERDIVVACLFTVVENASENGSSPKTEKQKSQ